ncbi:2-amino-4-hydroxy-6-hydroxymethyldihydropteridine diphosphokinase [Acinetobacter sp. B5B]|nr:2-amino-4-hydroxy-6-hydroxymethyldihydropteridine diphosphokinase [Acinetobacter baretiae]MBF7683609.1 2-amino-4-hydroxy-6-hydroxymethyldihydropteridine diphosphokinase [Acinetobacter baretiae]
MMRTTYIGLGSNLGDSKQILCQAVAKLATLGTVRVSQLYSTAPMGPQDQPDYLNAVVELKTTLMPLALLDALQAFEQESGRIRLRRWGERTLDLDLLWYNNQTIQHERLIVPHLGLLERDFVLLPLLDLNPNMVVKGQVLKELNVVQHTMLQPIANNDWVKQTTQ